MRINVKRLQDNAVIPSYATVGSSAMDITSPNQYTLPPGEVTMIHTGLAFEISLYDNYGLFLFSRSGLSSKNKILLVNGVGVIDPDYRGELIVALYNASTESYIIKEGDRVAQIIALPLAPMTLVEVDDIGNTGRGEGGFGSTDEQK